MDIKVFKTIKGKEPMKETNDISFSQNTEREERLICIFPDVRYQKINGFGGAFTESAATTLYKLSPEKRKRILEMYFDTERGIGYNFGRVHINSCDFSLGNYSCVEDGDEALETFNIRRDEATVIPMIKEAMKYNDIEIFASPWSPPAYMKTNGEMNRGGKLKKEYESLWAEYFEKFINAYKQQGINITTVSVQNEPKATQTWDSCVYTPEEERDFVKNHLGKRMRNIGVKVLFWDHNKERAFQRAKIVLGDKKAADYISGIAVHWYSGDHFEQLAMFKRLWPEKEIVFSEGCYEYSLGSADTVKIGERYAHDMIGNFNNYCSVFCDWNLLLDENGGPNHAGNFCDAPIMADTEKDKVYIHDSYYYIGHFSKYIKKGAIRIGSSKWSDSIETVSFENPDKSIVTIVLNRTETEYEFAFNISGRIIEAKSEARSVATYVFEL